MSCEISAGSSVSIGPENLVNAAPDMAKMKPTYHMLVLAHVSLGFIDPDLQVEHENASQYVLHWIGAGPVDVFVSSHPDDRPPAMQRIGTRQRDSRLETPPLTIKRPYFLLRGQDGRVHRAAERLLPLEGGSNFRDLGGYPGANGRHVRWGMLFRSSAMPKLTSGDDEYLSELHITTIVDLRSVDERLLSPTDWRAKPAPRFVAVDYPGEVLFARLQNFDAPRRESATEKLYAELPALMHQPYKALFAELLARRVPLVFHGSAGQDRTGVAAGLILSALGVPRADIYRDYLLSIEDRRPAHEMANVNLGAYARTNSAARFLIAYRNYAEKHRFTDVDAPQRQPLRDVRGRPLLQIAFEQMETDFGSIENYLDKALGLTARDIAKLRSVYLE